MTWKGIAQTVLDDAGVRVNGGTIEIPYRSLAGKTLRTRMVASAGRRWWAADGEGVHLFGAETLRCADPSTPVFVCEGESDTLAAREHFSNCRAVGSPGAQAFRAEWAALLEPFPNVYVIGDGDHAGSAFVWRVRRAVHWSRPVVCPEGRDLRELLQGGLAKVVRALLAEADWFSRLEDAVLHAPDLVTCVRWLRDPRERHIEKQAA